MVAMTEVFRVYLARGYFCPPTILRALLIDKQSCGSDKKNLVSILSAVRLIRST